MIFSSLSAWAATSSFTYEGYLTDLSSNPLTGTQGPFTFVLKGTSAGVPCILYRQSVSSVTVTNGQFSVAIDGSGSFYGAGHTLGSLFDTTMSSIAGSSCTFNATATDASWSLEIIDVASGTSFGETALTGAPRAFAADKVGGFAAGNLLRVSDSGTPGTATPFTSTDFSELQALVAGTSSHYVRSTSAGAPIPVLSSNASPAQGDLWFDSVQGKLVYYDGSATQTLGTGGGSVTSVGAGSGLVTSGSGPITTSGTLSLATVGAAGTGTKVTFDQYGRVTASTTLAEVDIPALSTPGHVWGGSITSGTIGGTTSISTSGNITATNITGTGASFRTLDVWNSGLTAKVSIVAPSGLGTSYNFVLPTGTGSANQILQTDGAGNLFWGNSAVDPTVFKNNGNSFGASAVIGTNDSNTLALKTNGISRVMLDLGGNVGIGTAVPNTRLDIAGTFKVADGGEACISTANGGMIRYNSNVLQFCNGSSWQTLGVSGAALGGDVSGLPTATSVDKLKGTPLAFATLTLGNFLRYNGTNWVNANLVASDVPLLDWSKIGSGKPTTLSGYGITDAVQNAGGVPSVSSGTEASRPGAGSVGRLFVATDTKRIFRDNGSSWDQLDTNASDLTSGTVATTRGGTGLASVGTANQFLGVNAGATGLEYKTLTAGSGVSISNSAGAMTITATGSGGTVTSVTSANSDIAVASGSTNPVLTLNSGTSANQIVKLDGSAKLPAVDGSALTSVNATKLAGTAVTITTLTSGNFLKYNGTAWVNVTPSSADLSDAGSLIKSSQMPANCSSGQTLTFSSPTGTWTCSNIAVTAGNFGSQTANTVLAGPNGAAGTPTFRTLTTTDLPNTVATISTSSTLAMPYYTSANTLGVSSMYYNGGNVGVNTGSPQARLHVNGPALIASSSDVCGSAGSPLGAIRFNSVTHNFEICNGSDYVALLMNGGNPLSVPYVLGPTGGGSAISFNIGNTQYGILQNDGSLALTGSTPALLLGSGGSQPKIVADTSVSPADLVMKTGGTATARLNSQGLLVDNDGGASLSVGSYGAAPLPMVVFTSGRGSRGAPSAVQSGDPVMSLVATGYGGNALARAGELRFQANQTYTNSTAGADFLILTANGTTNPTEKVRVTASGKMGVGISNPTQALEVAGTVKAAHFVSSTGNPSITGPGTQSVTGTDEAGVITYQGSLTASVITLIFASPSAATPICVVTAANDLASQFRSWVQTTTSTMALNLNGSLSTGTFMWNYICRTN